MDYRVAIKRRYNITDQLKQKMIDAVAKVFDDPESSGREIAAAAKVVIAAEAQNQADERIFEGNARVLEFAERLGIRDEVEQAAEESAGRLLGVDDASGEE